ncbi:MAG: SDR family oxidoreductase [Sulfurovum sp.]|nr:SDR family oxidoreductase [Sulfurovum sp.]
MRKTIILGASGYIGLRLSKKLKKENHELHLFNRNRNKISWLETSTVTAYDIEFTEKNRKTLGNIFKDADTLYYLIHSMSEGNTEFEHKDITLAKLIANICKESGVKKIVYLGGLGSSEDTLSKHLQSRQDTGRTLAENFHNVKEYRAGIIIGAGSSSFEIIRTLATKLPFIPVFWKYEGLCQPIFADDVISILKNEKYNIHTDNKILEIGCDEQITYSDLVKKYAIEVIDRPLKIIKFPFLEKIITPKVIGKIISVMTGQPKELVIPLIYGVKNDAIVTQRKKQKKMMKLDIALKLAAKRDRAGQILSVWDFPTNLSQYQKTETRIFNTQEKEGLLYEEVHAVIKSPSKIFEEIQTIGGAKGYWSTPLLWKIRGYIDRLFGGLGINSHYKKSNDELHTGDRIDFWTVAYINDTSHEKVLRLRSEMKTPGEAWLQFSIINKDFYLRAFFEPAGILGYLYWYSLYPIHKFIFKMMVKNIIKKASY